VCCSIGLCWRLDIEFALGPCCCECVLAGQVGCEHVLCHRWLPGHV
jgi:hypothetical protein